MKFSTQIPSRLDLLPEFISSLLEKVKVLPIKEEDLFNLKLSIEEALINAIKHGNKMDPHLMVEVNLEAKDDQLIIQIKDQGEGFDFKNLPDPTQNDRLEKTSGRGVFLMRHLMDEVEFLDCGRIVKMVKFLKKGDKQ